MPAFYDIVLNKGKERYRLNKQFIKKDNVPEVVLEALTVDNIVDENGLIIVDQKAEEQKTADDDSDKSDTNAPNDGAGEGESDEDSEEEIDTTQTNISEDENVEETEDESDEDEDEGDGEPEAPKKAAPKVATEENKPVKAKSAEKTTSRSPSRAARPVEDFRSKTPQSVPGMGFPRVGGKTVDIFDGKTPHTHVLLVGGIAAPLSTESFQTKTESQVAKRLEELGFTLVDFNELQREQNNFSSGGTLIDEEERDEDIKLG